MLFLRNLFEIKVTQGIKVVLSSVQTIVSISMLVCLFVCLFFFFSGSVNANYLFLLKVGWL